MTITQSEFLSDRVRVHYRCKLPWGVEDEDAVYEITHKSIRKLSSPAPLKHGRREWGESWEESVYVPGCHVTISFQFARWQESDDCCMEGLSGGPYLGKLESGA